jgi:hypothetical protein
LSENLPKAVILMRRPMAWNTALAIAAGTLRIPISPIPLIWLAGEDHVDVMLRKVRRWARRIDWTKVSVIN